MPGPATLIVPALLAIAIGVIAVYARKLLAAVERATAGFPQPSSALMQPPPKRRPLETVFHRCTDSCAGPLQMVAGLWRVTAAGGPIYLHTTDATVTVGGGETVELDLDGPVSVVTDDGTAASMIAVRLG